jgi:hypothetical protein
MIAWILTAWAHPLVRKITIYAAVILGILLCLRWYGNRQWQQGVTAGRQVMARELEKQKKAEWAAKESAIAIDAANITTEKKAVQAATDQLEQDRTTISLSLKNALASVAARKDANYATIVNVRASDLDAAIRSVSTDLAAPK